MELLIEDLKFTKHLIPYPKAGIRPDSRKSVHADQEPQQVMMDEVG